MYVLNDYDNMQVRRKSNKQHKLVNIVYYSVYSNNINTEFYIMSIILQTCIYIT